MRLETLSFSPSSKMFTVSGSIVEDISGRCLIRYLGQGDTFRIESSIEQICEEASCRASRLRRWFLKQTRSCRDSKSGHFLGLA
jgi:hypothetical protein